MAIEEIEEHPWTEEHSQRAAALFTADPNLEIAAIIIAMVHEHAIQYIEQAPILVLAMIKRSNMTLMDQQRNLIKLAKTKFPKKKEMPKLADLFEMARRRWRAP